MKNIYLIISVITALLCSNFVFAQTTETSDKLQNVLQKIDALGKADPAGADPVTKLSPEEKIIFREHEMKMWNEFYEKHPATSSEKAMLQTKAYGTDVRNFDFDWIPLSAPVSATIISASTGDFYADDIASNGNMYTVEDITNTLYIQNQDGTRTSVGVLSLITSAETVTGMSFNWTNSTMYLITNQGATPNAIHNLYTVNISNAAMTLLGTFGGGTQVPIWLEIDNSGNGFYLDTASDKLFSLNLATRATAEIGSVGFNASFAQDADFNRETNVLYWAAYQGAASGPGQLRTINTATGMSTLIGPISNGVAGETVEFSSFSVSNTLPAVFATNETQIKNAAIYPNPTSDFIHIDARAKITSVEITDFSGRLILSEKNNSNKVKIDISAFSPGVYWLIVAIDGSKESVKIIKK